MKFMSFLRFFGKRWLRSKPNRNRRLARPDRANLILEALERREMLAMDVPRIVSVVPADHSTTSNQTPLMQITFSEAMQGNNALQTGASDPTNYLLVDSNGVAIPVDTATLNGTATIVTLGYNSGGPLPSNTYTLFVHGDRLLDVDDSFPLAQQGQLFTANNGQNNLSVVNISADGTFNAPANYPQPTTSTPFFTSPTPWAVAHGDFNGDGIPDLVVVNSETNQVAIFAGRDPSRGGAFDLTPSSVLNLPTAVAGTPATIRDIKSIVVGFFDFDSLPDIAVANADSSTVSVFLNTSTAVGSLSFSTSTNVAAGPTPPIGMIAADFNSDGAPDLAVVNYQPLVADDTNYFVTLLMNDGNGTFGTAPGFPTIPYRVGETKNGNRPNSGLFNPQSIAAADFSNDGFPDLVVGGSNGLTVLLNARTGNNVTFNRGYLNAGYPRPVVIGLTGPVTALTTGNIAAGNNGPDIAALVPGGSPSVSILANNGLGTAFGITQFANTNVAADSQILLADIDGDTNNDILFTSGTSGFNSQVFTLQNKSTAGNVNFAPFAGSPYPTDSGPIGLDLLDTNGDGIPDLVTANSQGGDVTVLLGNADGSFRVPTSVPLNPFPTSAVATGDFNADGIADVVIVNRGSSFNPTQASVLLGLGNGTYTAPFDYDMSLGFNDAVSVTVADVNGDGKPDIIVASNSGNAVEILTNAIVPLDTTLTADSFFATATIQQATESGTTVTITTALPHYFVNGQMVRISNVPGPVPGYNGVFAITRVDSTHFTYTATVSGLANQSSGTASITPVIVGDLPTQVVAGDFNGDNKTDLAVSHDRTGAPLTRRGVTMLLGNGDGTFQPGYEVLGAQGVSADALLASDFNNDGKLDLVVANNVAPGKVRFLLGDGIGGFTSLGDFATGLINPTSLAVGDINSDGFADIIVGSQDSGPTTGGIAVLLNELGTGFETALRDNFLPGTPVQSLAVADVNQDGRPDVVIGTNPGFFGLTQDNVFTLIGNGDGSFKDSVPYLIGDQGFPTPSPSFIVATPTPLLRVTTFTIRGTVDRVNLARNGNFELRDLSGEPGNLLGWQTFKLANPTSGSHGQWNSQTGTVSPVSGVGVAAPNGNFQAMLDEADLTPLDPFFVNFNPASTYAGTNVLYQDILIPSTVSVLDISLQLYLNTDFSAPYSDASTNPALDYTTFKANQQVRVDFISPTGNILAVDSANGLLQNFFQTHPQDPNIQTVPLHLTTDPTSPFFSQALATLLPSIAGTTVRLRIAATNNQGKLIVGVDDVKITATYTDTTPPAFTGTPPHVRNPSFFSVVNGVNYAFTTDPTIVGRVNDNGSINNIAFVAFDPYGTNFTGAKVYKIITADALGNYTFTIPNLPPGTYNVGVRVVDRSGLVSDFTVALALQAQTANEWMQTGPNGVDVTGQGVGYTSVSGRVSATATDPTDLSGNTYYVGSANGGVWKTTDGGSSWRPLTDFVRDANGNPVPEAIGALAVARTNSQIVYAATGVADLLPDSRVGVGVFRSTNGGASWVVDGNSGTVLAGARISKIVIDNNNPEIAYAAVASGGASGPGVYKRLKNATTGVVTWVNVLVPTQMLLPNGTTLPAGTPLASVTDLVIDPFNSTRLLIGLGNISLVNNSNTAGVWVSANNGGTWLLKTGGDNPRLPNDTLPTGLGVGRVTLGIGNGRVGDEATVFVLISNPPTLPAAPSVNDGDYTGGTAGLYKTRNNLLDFTKVLLMQGATYTDANGKLHHDFHPIGFGVQGADYATLAVDPTNPSVVYVGGSRDFTLNIAQPAGTGAGLRPLVTWSGQEYQHSLIRVDTSNMMDTNTFDQFLNPLTIPNNGDDASKRFQAELNHAFGQGGTFPGWYDPKPPGGEVDLYAATNPEGVFWYDIEAGVSGLPFDSGSLFQLPPQITNLTFDAQGRLLIGTAGGLWRGVDHGFGYDFTSGGFGVVQGGNVFSTPGMTLTAINGNLQITELSSVAINPTVPGQYYTTQYSTGAGASSATLSWVSQGLVGPNVVVGNGTLNLEVPNALVVRAATRAPNALPSDPNVLYRIWQYADKFNNVNDLRPEFSADGGQTWTAIYDSGIPQSVNGAPIKSSPFPAFAVNPTKFFDSGQYVDELLLGTQIVFRTRTNANAWDPISPTLTSGQITAFGIAPSIDGYYYVGTDRGEIFVTTNSGADNWPLHNGGLPARRVNNIAVDPKDPRIAYAVLGGGAGVDHVWKTTNAGLTWTDISSNLPHVSANAIVIDRRPALGTFTGKLYVGTDVGVFVSINEGASWIRVGNSVPNAPIVDLQQNTRVDVLAAAAQGRGVFTISTAQISPIADVIIDTDVNTPGHLSNTGPLAFTINAVGVAPNGFSVTAGSSNQNIIPNANIVLGGSGTSRTVTVTPAPNTDTFATGPITISIVVTDTLGQSFTRNFLVTVLGNLVVKENSSRSFVIGVDTASTVTANSSDQTVIPSATNIVIGNPTSELRTVTITPAPGQVGTLFVTLIVTDTNGNQKTTTFAVDVSTPVVTLPFTDTFTRLNNPFMGTSWTVLNGSIPLQGNAGHVATSRAMALVNGVQRADVSVQVDATLPASGDQIGLIARQSGPGDTNEYVGRLVRSGASYLAQIFRFDNGVSTQLASADVTAFPGVSTTTTIQFVVIGVSLKLYVGTGPNNLAAFATDSAYARGSIGVRGSLGTIIDNFTASDVPVAAPVLPDDFSTSSASNQLDANWEDRVGNFSVAGGMARANQGGADVTVLRGADYANVVVSADINLVAGQRAGLVARYQGNGDNTMYLGEIDDRTGTAVAKISVSTGPNNFVILNTSTTTPGTMGTLRFVVNGKSLQLFLGNTLLTFATDNTLTQGTVGIRGNATTTFDNFNATALAAAQASFPFVEPFAPTPDGQLQAVWQIRQGDFQIPAAGGTAVGQDPQASDVSPNNPKKVNLAVLSGLGTTTDVDVSAIVNVDPGKHADLVLRYVDDNSFYLGMLNNATGAPMAQIYINRAGALTLLSQAPATSNLGTLDFKAVGGSLTLSLDGTPQTTVINDVLRAGSVGMRGSDTSFASFNANTVMPVMPFMDDFSIDGPLSASWATVYGTWAVSGGTAAGQANRNEAILPGVNSTDVVVFADVNVLAGQIAGLVARYSGAGDANNYLGMLNNSNGSPRAQIFYVDAAGAYTLLADAPASGNAGTLRFEVVGSSLRLFLNGAPQVAALNTALTQGAVGMRGSAGATFDNFNAMAAPAVLPFSDSFGTPGPLSNTWLNEVGNFTVAGGTANSTSAINLASLPGVNATDVVLTLDVNVASGQQAGLIARHLSIGNGSYYLGRILFPTGSNPRAQILRINGGVQTILADVPATGVVVGTFQTLRFEVVGTSLRLFFANTLQTFVTDATRTNGSVGMRTSNTSVDNFNATAYVPAAAGAGFSDNFSAGNAQGQLANTWATRVGDFTVTGGVANGQSTGVNLAVLGGVSAADVNLTVDVALAVGQQAGLVAHYNGTGDNSMYVAMLDNTSGTPVARIIRISSNGTQTVLASAAAPSGTGTLKFQIVGSSLRLLLGAALLVDVVDFNPLAAGSVGIRGSATTFDNFTS